MDFVSLSKILPLLVHPFNFALWLIVAALVLLWFERSRWAAGCIATAVAVLCVSGNPVLSSALYAHHERTYLPRPVEDYPEVDAIVALGGSIGAPLPPRLYPDMSGSVDRLLHAARLFRAGKADTLILSGGNVFAQPDIEGESYYSARLLEEWNVPASAIVVEDQSRNTYENAAFTKKLLDQMGAARILLVTSALHMPRALATFKSAGIDAIPAPTDYNIVRYRQPAPLDWIPRLGAIQTTASVLREHLGILVYRYRGWITPEAIPE